MDNNSKKMTNGILPEINKVNSIPGVLAYSVLCEATCSNLFAFSPFSLNIESEDFLHYQCLADELKGRIFTALGDAIAKDPTNRYLSGQLVKLGSAKICTIDAFYLELVRSNFSKLGIPASIRIGDTAELEVLSKEIMEETVDRFYDTDESFSSFAECFTGTRSSDQLADILEECRINCASYHIGSITQEYTSIVARMDGTGDCNNYYRCCYLLHDMDKTTFANQGFPPI